MRQNGGLVRFPVECFKNINRLTWLLDALVRLVQPRVRLGVTRETEMYFLSR